MRLENRFCDAQNRCCARFAIIRHLLQRTQPRLDHGGSQLCGQRGGHCLAHLCHQQHTGALNRFQDHIPCKSVADDHVRLIPENIAALNIAAEIQTALPVQLREARMGFLRQRVALMLLRAIADQAHAGTVQTIDRLHIGAAHQRKLQKILAAALSIRAAVDQKRTMLPGRRQHHGQCRAAHAGHTAHQQRCAC